MGSVAQCEHLITMFFCNGGARGGKGEVSGREGRVMPLGDLMLTRHLPFL